MKKITNRTNSPIQLGAALLPAFGAINVPELTDYTRLLCDLDIVAIEENKDTIEVEKPKRGRPRKEIFNVN